ncbi:hypothetical protein CBS101457_003074 [Exobasidium rhododendri]|nr:hypothetical protein CBS101457_003074 [Exobasidium rhododendri]
MFASLSLFLVVSQLVIAPFAVATPVRLAIRDTSPSTTLPPSQDPFYVVPDNIASYKRGSIIRSRRIPTNTGFGDAAGDAYQLLFRTNGVNLLPDATVTTVVAPKVPAKGHPKVVAIATPQDSPAFDCSTSFALYPDSSSNETSEVTSGLLEGNAALYNGYYVTIPDLEGSKSAFIAYSEGQVVLDSIRAIANHRKTIPNSKGYKAALTGYSGGGHGSAWAAQLASTYGKGIPIVALAAGGVPVDLEATLNFLDDTTQSSLVFLALAGLSNAYPKVDKYYKSILRQNGTDALALVRTGAYCTPQAGVALANKSFVGSTKVKYPNKAKIVQDTFDENFLGRHQKPITDFPVYLVHSIVDTTVPFGPDNLYYESQCSQGAKILFSAVPTGDHGPTGIRALAPFTEFIKQAFEGEAHLCSCRKIPDFTFALNSSLASEAVGPALHAQLQQLLLASET